MKAGVVFPQTEIGADPAAVRDYVQAAESLGFSHLIVYDHVLGADTTKHANWQGGYVLDSMFHEPFVLFGYLAGITTSIELVTAVLILGQRQTALVAKQAAQCDVLSNGRLRLGVGVGWNHVEYEALGEDFHTRGARQAEQVEVLRQLWTNETIDFHGKYHDISNAGINPLRFSVPFPSGWAPAPGSIRRPPTAYYAGGAARRWLVPAGRPRRRPCSAGTAGRLRRGSGPQSGRHRDGGPHQLRRRRSGVLAGADPAMERPGASHISINTMRAGYQSPQDHINAIQQFREVVG